MKRELNEILAGNEVYYPNLLISLVNNMLCSEICCQKGFISILFSYKVRRLWAQGLGAAPGERCRGCGAGWGWRGGGKGGLGGVRGGI